VSKKDPVQSGDSIALQCFVQCSVCLFPASVDQICLVIEKQQQAVCFADIESDQTRARRFFCYAGLKENQQDQKKGDKPAHLIASLLFFGENDKILRGE
jgi:hypothetical protein